MKNCKILWPGFSENFLLAFCTSKGGSNFCKNAYLAQKS